jgi:hypothetical protein
MALPCCAAILSVLSTAESQTPPKLRDFEQPLFYYPQLSGSESGWLHRDSSPLLHAVLAWVAQ